MMDDADVVISALRARLDELRGELERLRAHHAEDLEEACRAQREACATELDLCDYSRGAVRACEDTPLVRRFTNDVRK